MRRSVLMTQIGDEFGPGRLDQDVDLLGCRRPALGVADDPAHRVAGRDRTGADELLAVLQRDVGHLSGRGIDLVEGAVGERIDLHGIEIAAAARLNAGGGVRQVDALTRIARLRRRSCARKRLELARQRQRLWEFHDLHRLRRFALQHGRPLVVVADLRRLEGRAAGKRRGDKQDESKGLRTHQPSSFDQLMAWTNTPSGFLRSRSASCGVSSTMVRMAVQRSVAARLAFS